MHPTTQKSGPRPSETACASPPTRSTNDANPAGNRKSTPRPRARTFVVGLTILAAACAVAACDSRSHPAQPRSRRVLMIGPQGTHPANRYYRSAIADFAAQIPSLVVNYQSPAGPEWKFIEAELRAEAAWAPDVYLVYAEASRDAEAAWEWALGSQKLLATFGALETPPHAQRHLTIDLAGGAELLARALLDRPAGMVRSYAVVHAAESGSWNRAVWSRFRTALQADSSLRRMAEVDASGAPFVRPLIREVFTEFPSVPALVTLTPAPWLETPAIDIGGQPAIFTLGAIPELWSMLESGQAFALAGPLDGEVARAVLRLASEALLSGVSDRRFPIVGCELVTRDNLADFARRYAESAGMTIDDLHARVSSAPGPSAATAPAGRP